MPRSASRAERLDLSVGERHAVGFGAAALLLVTLVVASLVWLDRVSTLRALRANVVEARATAADELEKAVLYEALAARTYALTHDATRIEAHRRAADDARSWLGALEQLPQEPAGEVALRQIEDRLPAFEVSTASMISMVQQDLHPDRLTAAERTQTALRDAVLAPVHALAAREASRAEEANGTMAREVGHMRQGLLVLGPTVLALMIATALWTTRGVRRPALALARAARSLEGGDDGPAVALAGARPHGRRDELVALSHAFGRMALALRAREERVLRLARELGEGNERLRAQAEEIQSQNEELQAQQEEIQAQNAELHAQNEELHAQGEALEGRSRELHRALEALEGSEAQLRDADRRKDDFLAVLSHELRNPLAPIRNSLYVLDHCRPGTEVAERAKSVIDRQVGHLSRLVDDLLDVTRISRGKIQLQRTTVDLVDTLRHAADDHGGVFAAGGIDLRVSLPPGPLPVDGDPARLSQVIGNLLQNAAKFTPRGGRVDVALEVAGSTAVVRVADTGVGIEPALLGSLFEPFTQGDATLARTRGGLGLGLALVKGLVEAHGGVVDARSPGRDRGAVLEVRLPVCARPVRPEAPGAAPAVVAARRILVVEDGRDSAESLREVLALGGHEVEIALDGPDALERAHALRPDVILCDIGLPGMSGYDVARTVRGDERLRDTFLVALTGYALPEDRRRAADAGFDEHMAKPPSVERLEELLAALPPRHRPASLAARSSPGAGEQPAAGDR